MELHDLFSYDPSSGNLIWNERPLAHFTTARVHKMWNTRFASKKAGARNFRRDGSREQIRVDVFGVAKAAHRIIWEMCNGPIPEGMMIDHINGDPWDNRITNLRLATNSQNGMNRKTPKTNTSGFKGVTFNRASGKYVAQIKVRSKQIHLGYFGTAEEAHSAYVDAGANVHGDFFRCA